MMEVNFFALIGLIIVLISHTVAIVSVIVKMGGRVDTLEAKCRIIEKEFIPSMLAQMEMKNNMEARNRQLECSILTSKQIELMKDEIKELRHMMEKHLELSAERYRINQNPNI